MCGDYMSFLLFSKRLGYFIPDRSQRISGSKYVPSMAKHVCNMC
jgi:hypothetical protein